MEHVVVRRAESKDVPELAEMFHCLWPSASVAEHAKEVVALLADNLSVVLPALAFSWPRSWAVALSDSSRSICARTRTDAILPVPSVTSRDGMLRRRIGADELEQN
jgi:hypothetical protein